MEGNESLGSFLSREIVRASSEVRKPARAPVPRHEERVWWPREYAAPPSCEVEWVRPEMTDEFPDTPIRRPGRSPRSMSRGWQTRVPSHKAGRVLRGASYTEALHILDVEFDCQAFDVCEQPMSVRLENGARHRPDAFVWMRTGPHEVREVKKEDDAAQQEERWEAIGPQIASLGCVYRVVTDTRLHYPPRRRNIDLFMAHRHAEVPDDPLLSAMWAAIGEDSVSVSELSANFPTLKPKQIFALIRLGFIAVVNLDEPYSESTQLVRCRRNIRRVAQGFRRSESLYFNGSATGIPQ